MEKNEATEINDIAPSSLSHLIGQRGVIDQVRIALDAAQMDNKKFDHSLLVGPPGMGRRFGGNYSPGDGNRFSRGSRAVDQEWCGPKRSIVECQGSRHRACRRMPRTCQGISNRSVPRCGQAKVDYTERQVANESAASGFYFAALDDRRVQLATAVPDRMKLLLRFQFYDEAELVEVLRHRSKSLLWTVDDIVLPEIAKRAKGTPAWLFGFFNPLGVVQEPTATTRSPSLIFIGLVHWSKSTILDWDRLKQSTSIFSRTVRLG